MQQYHTLRVWVTPCNTRLAKETYTSCMFVMFLVFLMFLKQSFALQKTISSDVIGKHKYLPKQKLVQSTI